MSFLLYLIGSIVFIAGLAWIATLAGVVQTYVVSGAVVLLAAAILAATMRSRDDDLA